MSDPLRDAAQAVVALLNDPAWVADSDTLLRIGRLREALAATPATALDVERLARVYDEAVKSFNRGPRPSPIAFRDYLAAAIAREYEEANRECTA